MAIVILAILPKYFFPRVWWCLPHLHSKFLYINDLFLDGFPFLLLLFIFLFYISTILLLLFLNYLFIYFWLCWVFIAARGLSLVMASRGYSLLWCSGFSLRWLLLLRSMGSRHAGFSSCGSQALERRLSSCDAQA